jgi:DNA-binding Lrp family transcriptional regulator
LLVVTAYILIQTEVGKAAQVAKDIVEITGVQQAEDVTGPYDVIARAEARNLDELGKLVVARAGGRRHHEDAHLSGSAALELLRPLSGGRPTAATTATPADCGGRRRAAMSGGAQVTDAYERR